MASKFPSDVTYDFTAFNPENFPEATSKLNEVLIEKSKEDVNWWEVEAPN